jgi:hypothetical protein
MLEAALAQSVLWNIFHPHVEDRNPLIQKKKKRREKNKKENCEKKEKKFDGERKKKTIKNEQKKRSKDVVAQSGVWNIFHPHVEDRNPLIQKKKERKE